MKRIYTLMFVFVMLFTLITASGTSAAHQPQDFRVITDLPGLNLIGHNLAGSALLESMSLNNETGRKVATVTIVRGGDNTVTNDHIFNDAGAIELYYFPRGSETAVDAVMWSANYDIGTGYFADESILTIGSVHASEDRQMAYLTIVERMANGVDIVCLYIAQNVPGSRDVVLLDIVLFTNLWDRNASAALAELSGHIGINLGAYLP